MAPQLLAGLHHGLAVTLGQRLDQAVDIGAVDAAQHLAHRCFLQLAGTKGDGLVGEAERIAHGAVRRPRQQAQRSGLGRHLLFFQHLHQVFADGLRRHRPQVELQATRQHRHRHLLGIGGGENEFEVLGRLFQRLQHGVEGGIGEHVHFVDHENLEAPLHRFVDRLLQQGLDLVDTAVAGRIQFGVVNETATVDIAAGEADPARGGGDATQAVRPLAIERLGQNARDRGLANAPRSGEKIGVMQSLRGERVAQGLYHVVLAHHFRKIARTVFAGKHKVGHRGAF